MPYPLYDVVLTGEIAAGFDRQAVIETLSRLFHRDAGHIATLMRRGAQTIKRNVNAQTGRQYLQTLAKAGAVGSLTAVKTVREAKPSGASGPRYELRVLSPPSRPADVNFAPIQANRISRAAEGIDLNRIDTPPLKFGDIALLAAYEDPEAETICLLVFRQGQKRPYGCEANRIVFTDFPGTKATGALESLRLFMQFVGQQHPALYVDRPTAHFLGGRPPAILDIDLVKYTTTLGEALLSVPGASPE